MWICADEIDGGQDFVKSLKTVTFPPSDGFAVEKVFIEYNDDDINEVTEEAFYAVLRVTDSDHKEIDRITFLNNGVTLLVIADNDRKHFICCI